MPKQNQSMTPRELQICSHVNFARKEIIKWSQPDLARDLGITQNQLAGIEYKRAPLRFKDAKFLCEKFNISQRWLALGVLPMQPRYDVPMEYSYLVKPNSLFSWVFDGYLNEPTLRIEREWIKEFGEENFRAGKFDDFEPPLFQPIVTALAKGAFHNIRNVISIRFNWLPEDLQLIYNDTLIKAHEAFEAKYGKKIAALKPPAERKPSDHLTQIGKSTLTNKADSLTNQTVTPVLPKLIERLNVATEARGKKSELAAWLGVHRQSVTDWLTGKQEPGGETTLQLLHWVEQQERQK